MIRDLLAANNALRLLQKKRMSSKVICGLTGPEPEAECHRSPRSYFFCLRNLTNKFVASLLSLHLLMPPSRGWLPACPWPPHYFLVQLYGYLPSPVFNPKSLKEEYNCPTSSSFEWVNPKQGSLNSLWMGALGQVNLLSPITYGWGTWAYGVWPLVHQSEWTGSGIWKSRHIRNILIKDFCQRLG